MPDARLDFFAELFAVPTITLLSVITLPLIYFLVLLSPPAMVGIAQWLKTEIYDENASPEAGAALNALRDQLMAARKSEGEAVTTEVAPPLKQSRTAEPPGNCIGKNVGISMLYPNLDAIERGIRFKKRFFTRNGQPCEGGTLSRRRRP